MVPRATEEALISGPHTVACASERALANLRCLTKIGMKTSMDQIRRLASSLNGAADDNDAFVWAVFSHRMGGGYT